MRATTLALLVALSSPLLSTNAHAVTFRWPWETPEEGEARRDRRERDRRPRDPREDRRHGRVAPRDAHDAFVLRMLDNAADQLALARSAAERSDDRDVREMARRTIDEVARFEHTLLVRADELGLDTRARRGPVALPSRGWELDLAFLRGSMDVVFRDRAYFADYKSSVGGAFHDALRHHWDEMVERRDDVKRLHDDVRNAARRHGAGV